MTLVAIHFIIPARIHGLPNISMMDLRDLGRHSLVGWSAYVRGPAVFVVSPAGWKIGVDRNGWDANGDRQHFEVPRESVCLQWSSPAETLEDVKTWTAAASVVTDAELEKLTAPKGKAK